MEMVTSMWRLVRKQWKGEFPLFISFLLVGIGVQIARLMASVLIDYLGASSKGGFPFFFVIIFSYLAILALEVWWIGGTWASADNYKSTIWSPFAKAVTYVFVPLIALAYIYVAPPRLYDAYLNAREDPQWGPRSVIDKGRSLEVTGYLTRSVAAAIQDHLKRNPNLKSIVFDSGGGRVGAAFEIAQFEKDKGLDTVVSRQCVSACIVAFLGGRERVILADAQLGFHAATYAGELDATANDKILSFATAAGVQRSFMRRMLSSREILYPSVDDLSRSHVVTDVID